MSALLHEPLPLRGPLDSAVPAQWRSILDSTSKIVHNSEAGRWLCKMCLTVTLVCHSSEAAEAPLDSPSCLLHLMDAALVLCLLLSLYFSDMWEFVWFWCDNVGIWLSYTVCESIMPRIRNPVRTIIQWQLCICSRLTCVCLMLQWCWKLNLFANESVYAAPFFSWAFAVLWLRRTWISCILLGDTPRSSFQIISIAQE